MFFYRDPDEAAQQEQDAAAAKAGAVEGEQAAPEWNVQGDVVGPTLAAGQAAVPGQIDSGLDCALRSLLRRD